MSPIIIRRQGVKVEVLMRETKDVLAHCLIRDDEAVERIADILSQKRLNREAMELRQMMMDARKPRKKETESGRTGLLKKVFG